jgi:glycosyltransferase involved in cell wall biosynthesis
LDITVAVCTWNRAALLAETLGILSAVRVPAGVEWECLVIDNNSSDRTREVLASFAGRLPLRGLFEPIAGLARARNRAAREARGDFVLFLDDDIRVDREWLAAYVEAIARWPEASYLGGRIVPRYLNDPPSFVTSNLPTLAGLLGSLDFGPEERHFRAGENPYGGNMAVRRAAFASCRFDERLGHRHHERVLGDETDFFEELRRRAQQGVWVPAAKGEHLVPPEHLTLDAVYRHFAAYGRWLVRRDDVRRTWILALPRWVCRTFCLTTRARISLRRMLGLASWVPLLARCATWEGMLDEAAAALPLAQKGTGKTSSMSRVSSRLRLYRRARTSIL